jgi:ketosteroid isomerase-like protein
MSPVQLEQEVTASLDKSVAAFNQGLPEFFDDFADDATIFTVDSPEPIKGRDAYKQRYGAALTSQTRRKTITGRSVQIVGSKAVVTQTAEIQQAEATANVRQIIIYGETGQGLKVLHLHTSLLTPQVATDVLNMAPIRVVNERIATISAQAGVAQ